MKISKKLLTLGLILTIAMTGCGTEAKNENNGITPNPTAEAQVTAQPSPSAEPTTSPTALPENTAKDNVTTYPLTITDSTGATITFEQEPQTMISFAPNITEIIYELKLSDKLIGRTDYCDYPSEVMSVESIGDFYNPDVEKIVSLAPDVVLASSLWTEDVIQKFKEVGITVVVLNEDKKISGINDMIDLIGQIFNSKDSSAKLIESMKAKIEDVTTKVASYPKKTVYYVVGFGEYGDYTAGGDTFTGDLLTLAGGDNIAKDVSGWSYTLESLIEADPEVILIASSMKDSFITSENYKNLSAVKNNQVYGIDNNLLDRQSYRVAEGVELVAKLLHPEAFQ